MGSTIRALLDLQDIELQLVDIRRQVARKERRVAAQERKLAATRRALTEQAEQIKRAQVEFDEADVDVKGRSANIARMREHLNTVRTNKEYAAILAQINTEKADVTRLENRALEMMQAVEARRDELKAAQASEQEEAKRVEEARAELEQSRQSFADRLERLNRQRQQAAEQLPPDTVALFDRLSERYDGECMAIVERVSPRRDEYICGGCHMALRAEAANMLKIRDDVVTCSNCGRILHLGQDR